MHVCFIRWEVTRQRLNRSAERGFRSAGLLQAPHEAGRWQAPMGERRRSDDAFENKRSVLITYVLSWPESLYLGEIRATWGWHKGFFQEWKGEPKHRAAVQSMTALNGSSEHFCVSATLWPPSLFKLHQLDTAESCPGLAMALRACFGKWNPKIFLGNLLSDCTSAARPLPSWVPAAGSLCKPWPDLNLTATISSVIPRRPTILLSPRCQGLVANSFCL